MSTKTPPRIARDAESHLTTQELLKLAVEELENLHSGEIFVLADLFKGYEWKRIPGKDRTLFGRYFCDFVTGVQGQKLVAIQDTTVYKHLRYVRK